MDEFTLNKNAGRVATIFNVLSIVVVIVGILAAIGVLIAGFIGAGVARQLSEYSSAGSAGAGVASIFGGILGAVATLVYTLIAWAGVQLAALVAGYIKVRTGPGQAGPGQGAPTPPYQPV